MEIPAPRRSESQNEPNKVNMRLVLPIGMLRCLLLPVHLFAVMAGLPLKA